MANAVPKLFDNIQQNYLTIYLFNPAKRFITSQDEINAINAAAVWLAMKIGGLRLKDDSTLSVAGQRDYVLATQHKRIVKAQYVQNINTPTEVITPLDIVDTGNMEFISLISQPAQPSGNLDPSLAGTPQAVPKYVQWWPEINTLRVFDTPSHSGDTFRLLTRSLPSGLAPGVSYDGSEEDLMIIGCRAAGDLTMGKKNDQAGGQVLLDQADKMVVDKINLERAKRRPRQMKDGRYEVTRLRSINGSN